MRPFQIERVIYNNAYIIDLPFDFNISHAFNISDQYPYHPPDKENSQLTELEMSSFQGGKPLMEQQPNETLKTGDSPLIEMTSSQTYFL